MTELWYTTFAPELPPAAFAALVARLPPAWQHKVWSRQRPASRYGTLFGSLLLQRVLHRQPQPYSLAQVQHTPDNRPYLAGAPFDFNISHSGTYVACALSFAGRVGLDLEHRTRTNIAAFEPHFEVAEWASVQAAPDPARQFYRLWTQKEAVAKADGRGLNIPLSAICLSPGQAVLEGTRWYLQEVTLAGAYSVHVASDHAQPVAAPRRVRFAAPIK